jgi:Zn-dependent protease
MGEDSEYKNPYMKMLEDTVGEYFEIESSMVMDNRYIFYIKETKNLKERFIELRNKFKERGNILPLLEKDGDKTLITILGSLPPKRDRKILPILLFLATLGTVSIDGYLRSMSPVYFDIIKGYNPVMTTITFTLALLGIIGIHEIGHKIALSYHGIKASWPNFIPGVPGVFPTFGAVISQREPPTNRDILFDIGFAGPIAGFIVTIIVTIYAALTAPIITMKQLHILEMKYQGSQPFPVPVLYTFIQDIVRPTAQNQVVIVSPLIWASVVGFIITGLNLLPAWQLDGGHLARATVGERYHGLLTIISVLILFLTGYWVMALFVLFLYMSTGRASARPLDDATPLSTGRKILFIISIILAFLCLPNVFSFLP